MSGQPPKKKNVISVSANSGFALSAELELMKKKFNSDRTSQISGSSSKDVEHSGKVYKKGTARPVKGYRNKLEKVSERIPCISTIASLVGLLIMVFVVQELRQLGPRNKGTKSRDEKGSGRSGFQEIPELDDKSALVDERTTRGKKSLDFFHETSYQALLEKSQIYDQMKSGQYENDEKAAQKANETNPTLLFDERGKPRPSVLPKRPKTEDVLFEVEHEGELMAEVEDEFGRTRLVPQSEAYLYKKLPGNGGQYWDDQNHGDEDALVARPKRIIRGDVIQKETFKLDEDKAEQLRNMVLSGEGKDTHYDPDWEIRTKGTGFYKFETVDEKMRKQQMDSIHELRRETEQAISSSQSPSVQDSAMPTPSLSRAEQFLAGLNIPVTKVQSDTASQQKEQGSHSDVESGENSGSNIDSDDPLLSSHYNAREQETEYGIVDSKIAYERKVNERRKLIDSLRKKRVQNLKSFVKGSDL